MTRKIMVNMYMTLDGYGEFPKYPGPNIQSKEPGEGFTDMWINRYGSVDTIGTVNSSVVVWVVSSAISDLCSRNDL